MFLLSSLRGRMVAFVLAAAFAISVATCGIVAWKVRESLTDEAYLTADTLAAGISTRVEREFEAVFASARAMSDLAESQKVRGQRGERAAFDAFLLRSVEHHPGWLGAYTLWEPNAFDGRDAEFRGAACHDATGRYVPYWVRSEGKIICEANRDYDKPGTGDYYQLPLASGKSALIDPYPYAVAGKELQIVSFVVPVIVEGRFQGITGVDYLLSDLNEQLSKVRPYGQGHVEVVAAGGNYAVSSDPARLGKASKEGLPEAAVKAVANGGSHRWEDADGWLHTAKAIQSPSMQKPWTLVVSFPMAAALKGATGVVLMVAVVFVLGLLLLGAIVFIGMTKLLSPIARLRDKMSELANGEGDLTSQLDVRGKDEIGEIAASFNRFLGTLRGLVAQVKSQSGEVSDASRRLGRSAQQVSAASQDQAQASASAAGAVSEIVSSIHRVAEDAGEASSSAQIAERSAREAAELMLQSAQGIERVHRTITSLSESLRSLDERSARIGDVISLIKDVADQTNLLALNAAIEAARAGEQGRGFAVVADEVRKLAERTTSATGEIGGIILAIQKEAEQTVTVMAQVLAEVTEGEVRSKEGAQGAESIRSVLNDVLSRMERIAANTSQQAAAGSDILAQVERIGSSVRQNESEVMETASAVSVLGTQADELARTVGRFRT